MVAEDNDLQSGVIQVIQALRNGLHRNQCRAFDVANGVLCRFPNIDETKRRSSLQELTYFRRSYLDWQFIHRPRV